MTNSFSSKLEAAAGNLKIVQESDYGVHVQAAVDLLYESFSKGGKLLVFGNGGSAADAQHICGELVGRFLLNRRPLPAIALTADSVFLTAWSNDFEFESIFSRQVEAHGEPGDVAWGISTSGNSKNVIAALKTAREMGLRTIGMTGQGGGAVAPHCDALLAVPLKATPDIQEIHVMTYHHICAEIERKMFS